MPLVCISADTGTLCLARDAVDRFAVADRHGRTAVPGPMTGRCRRARRRPGHIGILLGRAIGAETVRAVTCRRSRDGRRLARRRQGLRFDTGRCRRCRHSAGDILRRSGTIGVVCAGVKARGIRTTGSGDTNQLRELQRATKHAGETPPWDAACGYSLVRIKRRV